jgi:hypothetical protein
LTFAAGTTTLIPLAGLLLFAHVSREKKVWVVIIGALALLTGVALGLKPVIGWQLGVWLALALTWLITSLPEKGAMTKTDWWLGSWILLGLAGLLFSRGWVCARYFVILGPAFVLWTVRALETKAGRWMDRFSLRLGLTAGLGLLSLGLAAADFAHASVNVKLSRDVSAWQEETGRRSGLYYCRAGLIGVESALDRNVWEPKAAGDELAKGDVVLLPFETLPPRFFPAFRQPKPLAIWVYNTWIPLRVLAFRSSAGFYGSIWGALPFAVSTAPLETAVLAEETAGSK